jgi:hypothetical protein
VLEDRFGLPARGCCEGEEVFECAGADCEASECDDAVEGLDRIVCWMEIARPV